MHQIIVLLLLDFNNKNVNFMYTNPNKFNQHIQENQSIMATILQNLPKECSLTKIEYEGPRIALYSNNPKFLLENSQVLSNIVNLIKKRIILRIDESIRKSESEVTKTIKKILPKELGVSDILFDPTLGEITVYIKKTEEILNVYDQTINELTLKTGWKINIKRTPKIITPIKTINKMLTNSTENRAQFYKRIGEKVFREKLDSSIEASLISLGGFGEIGRSSMILSTNESNIIIDCGLNLYTDDPLQMFPRFDTIGIKPSEFDAVLLTHGHFDHTGFLPMIFKYGYNGPVYCTEPTAQLMYILFREYLKENSNKTLYGQKDIERAFSNIIFLNYNTILDISPDVKVTPFNSGHILGSTTFHFHIGNGDHNFVYTGDIKFGKSSYLDNAVWNFPRVETLLIEATNGGKDDAFISREDSLEKLTNDINPIIKNKKIVLIPVQLSGSCQEIIITLDQLINQKKIKKCKIFIDKLIVEINSIHEANTEFLNKELQKSILNGEYNPFRSKNISIINILEAEELNSGIIILPSSMMQCKYSGAYLKKITNDDQNMIIFTSNQSPGTIGKDILDGQKNIIIDGESIELKCRIEKNFSFNSHSDFNQLNAYIARLRPKLRKILINHGDRAKVQNLASYVSKVHNIPTQYILNQEAVKLL